MSNRRLLIGGSLAFALAGAVGPLYGLAIPLYREAWGPGGGGALLALHGAGAMAAVAGGVFGLPHLTLRTALALLAAGLGLSALAVSWGLAFVGATVIGMGFGLLSVVINRRFLSEFGTRGPGMLGFVNAVFGLGSILSPLALVAAGERLTPVYLALALVSLALIPVVQPSGRQPRASGLPDLRQPRLAILGFIHVAVIVEVALFGLGPTALGSLGIESGRVAALTSGFFAAFLVARLALYWLARLVRPEHLFAAGLAGTALAMGVAVAGAPALGFVLAGASVGIQFPSFFVWATGILGTDSRLSAAILGAAMSGAITGPLLLAPVLGAAGSAALFPVVAVVAGMTGVLYLACLPWARRQQVDAATGART